MRLSANQLDAIAREIEKVHLRSDGLIVGQVRLAIEDLAETVIKTVLPELVPLETGGWGIK